MKWIKSALSNSQGACVELAATPSGVAMRDSKDPQGPVLRFTKEEIAAFFDGVEKGEFSHLIA